MYTLIFLPLLDYNPPVGFPSANTTFRPQDISDVIEFSRGLPGTKYDFKECLENDADFPRGYSNKRDVCLRKVVVEEA